MVDLSQAKEIEGYTDYWIFPNGRIWSNKQSGRFLSQTLRNKKDDKYYRVQLSEDGVKKTGAIHILVAETFIGPRPLGEDGKPLDVDHIDQDSLNNHVSNLRYATKGQNQINSGLWKNNTSGYKGVTKHRAKWTARLSFNGQRIHIGSFLCKIEAAKAYDKKAYELFGEFAWLNFPEDYR